MKNIADELHCGRAQRIVLLAVRTNELRVRDLIPLEMIELLGRLRLQTVCLLVLKYSIPTQRNWIRRLDLDGKRGAENRGEAAPARIPAGALFVSSRYSTAVKENKNTETSYLSLIV